MSPGTNRLLTQCLPVLLIKGSIHLGPSLPLVGVVAVTLCHWVEAHEMLDTGLPYC